MSFKLLNTLLIALSAVLYLGFLSPYYTGTGGLFWTPEKSIKELQSQNVQYTNTLNQINLIKDAANALSKDFSSVPEDVVSKVNVMLADSVDPVKLRNEVLYIAGQSGIAVNNLEVVKDQRGEKNLNFYRVSFSMKARYADLKKFVEKYERSKRLFVVENVSISRQKIDERDKSNKENIDESALDVRIVSRVYYMK